MEFQRLEVTADVLHDGRGAGEDRDVLHHGLAAVTVARSLHRAALQDPAQAVHHQGGEGLALHILGDDQERATGLAHLLEQRDELLDGPDLLLVDEDERVLQDGFHLVGIGDEVRREVSPVELHPLDDVHGGGEGLALLHGDHAVLPGLLQRVGDHLADFAVGVRGDRRHVLDLALVVTDLAGVPAELLDHGGHGGVDAALERHGVTSGHNRFLALEEDRLGEDGGGGGPVAGHIRGLAGHLTHEARGHVLVLVPELDLLGDGHPVLGDRRSAPALVEHGVPAFRSECGLHGTCEVGNPRAHPVADLLVKGELLRHGGKPSGYLSGCSFCAGPPCSPCKDPEWQTPYQPLSGSGQAPS